MAGAGKRPAVEPGVDGITGQFSHATPWLTGSGQTGMTQPRPLRRYAVASEAKRSETRSESSASSGLGTPDWPEMRHGQGLPNLDLSRSISIYGVWEGPSPHPTRYVLV